MTKLDYAKPMRLVTTLTLLAFVPTAFGCAFVDGRHSYTVSGRLVDDRAQPLADHPIALSIGSPWTTSPPTSAEVPTADDGGFSYTTGGQGWGYMLLFGIIPLGPTNPSPPRLDRVWLAVEQGHGKWVQAELPLTRAQQRERGRINLGDVTLPKQEILEADVAPGR